MSRCHSHAWLAASCLTAALLLSGCAVDEQDLHRWETTLTGPERLTAVVIHDKYDHNLRVQAALSLIHMKPRKGQHVGVTRLVEKTLAQLPPDTRAKILRDLVPLIIEELKKPPPEATQGGQAVPDPSFKYKDAAYLMLTFDKTQIISDPELKTRLHEALTEWAMADFETRLNERSQAYGMEQLLRHIGPSSVKGLPALMQTDSRNLAKMADIVAKIGDKETKEAASGQLVKIVKYVSSKKWRDDRLPELKEANRKAGFDPTEKQLDKQMADFQEESVTRIFASMKKVGGKAVVNYCLDLALDKDAPEKRRQTALAALEGHVDRKDPEQVKKLLAVAKDEKVPDIVVDQAFRRLKEMPRALVVDELYELLSTNNWQRRRLAAATVLQMSTTKQIDEFMAKLGAKVDKNFHLPEAITYGAYLADLKGGKLLETLEKHMRSGAAPARISAISYYYAKGTKNDLSAIAPFENDGQKVPACDEDAGCDWVCEVATDAKGEKKESKEIRTVGEFVRYCIRPKLEQTEPEKEKGKDDKKK